MDMMKHIYPFLFVLTTTFACGDSDETFCISGKVVAFNPCTNISVIEVDPEHNIGGELARSQDPLKNAIQVPGEFAMGRGNFRLRKFRDSDLVPTQVICFAIYAPLTIPSYTVIARNDSRCP
jgi:hypothetical protein